MRDTSVRDEDLAIELAKQKLATLKDRPGYLAAMKKKQPPLLVRAITLGLAALCGITVYGCALYVTLALLKWFLIILFGFFVVFFVLATIGLSPRMAGSPVGVAILDKQLTDGKHKVTFLRESGERHELDVKEELFDHLRPGDLGVARITGTPPDYSVDSFERL